MTTKIFTHTSRSKKKYYIHKKINKKGTVCYYLSPKEKGDIVKQIPKGFEIYDHPETNQPFIRRKQPQLLSEEEKAIVEEGVKKFSEVGFFCPTPNKVKFMSACELNLRVY